MFRVEPPAHSKTRKGSRNHKNSRDKPANVADQLSIVVAQPVSTFHHPRNRVSMVNRAVPASVGAPASKARRETNAARFQRTNGAGERRRGFSRAPFHAQHDSKYQKRGET
jgi:hypothetical protein